MKYWLALLSLTVIVGCADDSAGRTSEKKNLPTTANNYDPQTGLTGDDVDKLKGEK